MVSFQLGSWQEMTLSCSTPCARRPWATRSTARASASQVYLPRPSTSAVLAGRSRAHRSRYVSRLSLRQNPAPVIARIRVSVRFVSMGNDSGGSLQLKTPCSIIWVCTAPVWKKALCMTR